MEEEREPAVTIVRPLVEQEATMKVATDVRLSMEQETTRAHGYMSASPCISNDLRS
jgi:hypothetical protein